MKDKKLFQNIAGYEDVKRELMDIYSWYKNKSLLNNKEVYLPRGIIFQGPPGNGKTLFLREFVKSINAKTYYIRGLDKDIVKEIHDIYESARKESFAIVLIDEFDLLITKNPLAVRAFQTEIDGPYVPGQILTIATSNTHTRHMPEALFRPGRFDRIIEIGSPTSDEIVELFKFYLNKFKIDSSSIDLKHLSNLTRGCSCAGISSIVNDAFLRCQNKITTRDLERSYERLVNNDYSLTDPLKYKNKKVAIHEAGHAIMAIRFSNDVRLYNAKFTKGGGVTNTYIIDKDFDSIEKRLEQIQIALAGATAEEIFYKHHDIGSIMDLYKATVLSDKLIERTCCKSLSDFHQAHGMDQRSDTEEHHRIIEKKSFKLLNKQKKLVYRYLKKHKKDIEHFATMLYTKGEVNLHDLSSFKERIDKKPISCFILPKKEMSYAKELNKIE